jgi:transglutaminase-like putative cysteine protease
VTTRAPTAGSAFGATLEAPVARLPLPGVPSAARASDPAGRWDLEVALAAMSVVGLLGFHRVFAGAGWIGPVIGTTLGVQLVCLLTRRWVRHLLVAGLIDVASVVALSVWTVVPSSTFFGLPRRETWRTVHASLAGVAHRLQAATVPVHPTTDFLLLAVVGAGTVALAGSWLAFRLGRTLAATLPSLAAFIACCCLGTRAGRSSAITLEVLVVFAFVVVQRLGALSSGAWFASRADGAATRTLGAALPGVAIGVVVALALVPSFSGADGHGALGWRSAGADSPRIVISPLVSLSTRLLHQSSTDVFTVQSSVPSYWRLTSLDYFDGSEWNARDTYQQVDETLPGTVASPHRTTVRVVRERFHIQQLDSVWLPLAFDPKAVSGAGKVSYDPRSGSLLTPAPTSNRLEYTVTSLRYLDTLSARDLRTAPAVTRSAATAPYLQLPPSVSTSVRALARSIVAGKTTEYAKAYALQEFFYQPEFTYSLQPPSDGAGTAALETFLFKTRTGYCQQFAGAFAVLARAVGLPTRLAIGFTTGRPTDGGYQVTDADAHTWPEVWFPSYGWVPFEPTKGGAGNGFVIPGATAYTGNTAATTRRDVAGSRRITSEPATTVPVRTGATAPKVGAAVPHATPRGFGTGTARGSGPLPGEPGVAHHAGGHLRVTIFAVALGILALLVASNALGPRFRWAYRRRRATGRLRPQRRHAPDAPGAGTVLADTDRRATLTVIWEEVAEQLAWEGLRRGTAETPHQFAGRVTSQRRHDGATPLGSHLDRLAEIFTEAEYSSVAVSAVQVEEADLRGRRIASVLDRHRARRVRLRLLLDPRLAWRPTTVEPLRAVWLNVTVG